MKSTRYDRTFPTRTSTAILLTVLLAVSLCRVQAQTAMRYLGSITAVNGNVLTVKTDAGEQHQVEVPESASLKRIEPGQKDLSAAADMTFADFAVGDRVLVKIDPNATGATATAAQVIAIKAGDVAQKQQKDREDWQKNGVGGLVKAVDAQSGTITVISGAGSTAKTITVHTMKATLLKRYAPASVAYDQATAAPIDAIHAGDQLRARGTKNADGTEVAADEVVSGSFRNISGLIASIDPAASTLTVKDLATRKIITIHVPADTQMRKIPERMAQMLAARLKGISGGGSGSTGGTQRNWGGAGGSGAAAGQPAQGGGRPGGQPGTQGGYAAGGNGGDMQQMLSRAPAIHLSDLQKGAAVMVVSTDGATDVTAITLLAGVEPLLEAPAANNLLSNWSMGGGGGESGAGQQ